MLRRVKVAAAKLNLGQVEGWVETELNGYHGGEVPGYRRVSGQLRGFNPFHGWIPISGLRPNFNDVEIRQSVESIEQLLRKDDSGRATMPVPTEMANLLDQSLNVSLGRYAWHLGHSHLVHIVGSVRNLVLDWALKLEEKGIAGADFTFTFEEKARAKEPAAMISIGSIGNFAGNLGQGNTAGDITTGDIAVEQVGSLVEQAKRYADELAGAGVDLASLKPLLATLETECAKPRPSHGVLRGALTDVRNLLSGAGGSVVAAGILSLIQKILGG